MQNLSSPAFRKTGIEGAGNDPALDALRRSGLRITAARVDVFNALQRQGGFVRPETLFRIWLETRRQTNISTIYRALTDLSKAGVILKARDAEGRNIYATPTGGGDDSIHLYLPELPPIPLHHPALRREIEEAARAVGIELHGRQLGITVGSPDPKAP